MDCKAKVVITATGVRRGKKKIGLKAIVDDALASCKMNGFEVRLLKSSFADLRTVSTF